MSSTAQSRKIKGHATPFSAATEETTVKLSPDILQYLREAAAERGVTTGDMVRIALGTHKFIADKVQDGAKVQLRDKDRTLDLEF